MSGQVVNWKCHCYSDGNLEISENKEIGKPGVYILGSCVDNKFKAKYIGGSENMRNEIKELENGTGGNDCIKNFMNIDRRSCVMIKFIVLKEWLENSLEKMEVIGQIESMKKYLIIKLRKEGHELCNDETVQLTGLEVKYTFPIDYSCCDNK